MALSWFGCFKVRGNPTKSLLADCSVNRWTANASPIEFRSGGQGSSIRRRPARRSQSWLWSSPKCRRGRILAEVAIIIVEKNLDDVPEIVGNGEIGPAGIHAAPALRITGQ
jgi:hypothetical protein